MQPRLLICLSAAFAACILLLAPAQAQVNLFTQGQGLSPEDNRLLFDSIARLNGTQPARTGNSDTWSNPQSNDSGTNTVLRVFRSGGMACHLVQHHIVTGGTGATTASLGAARRAVNGRSRPEHRPGFPDARVHARDVRSPATGATVSATAK